MMIWDASSHERLFLFRKHTDYVHDVAYSPDGERLVSGSWDGTIIIWDTKTGLMLHKSNSHGAEVMSLAWSADGQMIAVGTRDNTVTNHKRVRPDKCTSL